MNDQTPSGDTSPDPERRRRRRLILLATLTTSLFISSIIAVGGSLAMFTSTPTLAGNAFTTGTVVLGLNPASALLTSANMMPGDSVAGSLVVSNTGTAQLRYAMTSASTNADGKSLMTQISLTVKTLGTSCAAFDGTSLFSGALNVAAFGNPTQGANAGDRTLNAAATETLCFQANLPLASGNAFQGAATTTTFTFSAEQTANNP
jgi:hypothetical protein